MKCDLRASVAGLVLLALAPVSSSHAQATPTGRPTASDYSVELYKPGYFTNFEWPTSTPAVEIGPFTSIGSNELLRVRQRGFGYEAWFTAMRPDDASETPLVALQTRPPTPYGSTIVGALAADYNHDGRVEMLIASSAALEMITYDGNAAVSAYFQNLPGTLWIDSTPVAADFDRDGHMDVAFHQSHTGLTPAGTQARLVIFRGNGANYFAEEVDITTGGPNLGDRQRAVRMTSSDFNNDGWPDVAILFRQLDAATKTESRPIKVFLNNGAGALMPPYTLSDDSTLLQISAGDVDNDGLADLVATSSGGLHVFRQNGDGQLALAYSLPAQESSRAVEIADLDGDGRLDVVSGSSTTYRIASYIQQRTGMLAPAKFSAPISNEIENYYRALSFNADSFTVTDLTADGCNDLLITQGEWRLRGQGCARTLYTPGDFNDDGKADLLWRHHAQRDLALWKMDGSIRVQGMGYVVDSAWKVLSTGDFNGDRWMDLLWSDGHNMQLWEGDGLGRFLGSSLPEFPQGWRLVTSGDFDRDGKDDLFWRNAADTDAALWRMDGAKILETRGFATSPAWRIEGSGDFNGDGRRDLLWTNGVHMQLWQTQPDLTFAGVDISDFPRGWKLSGVTDVNGDGNEDLLWFLPQLGELAIWEIHGASDIRGRGYSVGRDWRIIQTGDFNADGYGDLVWSNGRNMQLWQSQGSYFQGLQMDAYPTGWSIIHR